MTIGTFMFVLVLAGLIAITIVVTHPKQRAKRLLHEFHSWMEQLELSVSSQEVSKARVLGIDCRAKKVLYLKKYMGKKECIVIDLNDVTNCSYRKVYLKTPFQSNRKEVNMIVSEILLEFDKKDFTTVSFPLYHYSLDGYLDTKLLERKARNWEVLIEKLIEPPVLA